MVEFYVPGESWIHRADPRVKFALVAVSIPGLLILQHPLVLAGALLVLNLLYTSAGLPATKIWRVVRTILPVSLLMMVLRAIFYPLGPEVLTVGPLHLTVGGLAQGAALGLRLLAMALSIFLWLFTTQSQGIVRGMVKLGLPYPWGLSVGLALRFIPTLRESYETITQAQRARGLDLEGTGGLRRARVLLPGFVALMVSSFRTSENLARALEARAFGARGVRRSYLADIAFRPLDWVYLLLIALVAAALLFLHFRLGFGADPLRLLP